MPFEFGDTFPSREGERQVVVPTQLETKAALFAFLREALQLPAYFGNNWDALNDCFGDLASGDEHVLLVHRDLPLAGHPTEQRIYLEVLAEWTRSDSHLRATFPEMEREPIQALLPGL